MFSYYSKMYSNTIKQDPDAIIIGKSVYKIEDN